ncbi:MAG: DoxX family membrane protein [Alphaproteobacteria bacterium]|nr:DoxX family membrane protein [Alphaproteobacteria bacterium]
MMLGIAVTFAVRALLVALFLPFSALDKILNTDDALRQCGQAVPNRALAKLFLAGGFAIEVFMSMGVLTGIADRLAAVVLAAYCATTALLWKQFWHAPDFRLKGPSRGRDLFWDFLKNLALAGGFLLLTFGANADGVSQFLHDPLGSTHPYAVHRQADFAP